MKFIEFIKKIKNKTISRGINKTISRGINSNLWGIILGFLICYSGAFKILSGKDGMYWDFTVPFWSGYFTFPIGVTFIILSIRAILRGKDTTTPKPVYTEEDFERDKKELDQVYLKLHGKLPGPPKPDQPKRSDMDKWYW